MALSIFSSNDVLSQKYKIGESIREQLLNMDPFKPVYIVTQTEGMNVWLKTKLAEQLDITANIIFINPNDLVTRVNKIIGGEAFETFPKESVSWVLYELLSSDDFLQKYGNEPVTGYYLIGNVNDKRFDDAKRYALAAQLSDLYDQYQIYRHQMIQDWNERQNPTPCFQEYLWIALKAKLGDKLQDKTIARKNIIDQFNHENKEQWELVKNEFNVLYFFGLSIFTPFHFDIFQGLSQYMDLVFYLLNPSPEEYWYEDKSERIVNNWKAKNPNAIINQGNDILTNWGKVIQDTFYLFFDRDENINNYTSEVVPVSNKKLLGKLQNDILTNSIEKNKIFKETDLSDKSLQIHSSYNKAREVEALYNAILNIVENDNTITGKDIVVTCDIDEYASYISAIFDTAPKKFKYTIADSVYLQGDSPLKALESLLNLSESNFNAETLLQLLDFSCIKKKFGIQNSELIALIVEKSLFRFGIEGSAEDDSNLFSLKNSIRKIVLGISLKIQGKYKELYPLDIIEGFDSEEALKFCVFADALVDMLEKRGDGFKTLQEWTEYVDEITQDILFLDNEEDEKELRHQSIIVRQLGNFYLVSDAKYCSEKIKWNIFVNSFLDLLGKDRRTKRYVSNGITFCSHIPMRSLPYKVVCMLGLDFDKFPRKDRKLSFSKISGTERGDRSVRENDKHLFLESLMSAKEYFYLSYIGNSSKDNTNIPASVLVEELITYIADRCERNDIAQKLITRHPLYAYSKKYNIDNPNLVSYLIDTKSQQIPMKLPTDEGIVAAGSAIGNAEEVEVINLDDLINFFKNPIKYYYNKVLKIYYENQDALVPMTEMFEMDKLEEWGLKDRLMNLRNIDEANIRDLIIKGELPSKNMGEAYFNHYILKIAGLHSTYWQLRGTSPEGIDPEQFGLYKNSLRIDSGLILEGELDNLFNNHLLGYSLSSNPRSRKNLIGLYIQFLFLKALDIDVSATFIKIHSKRKIVEIFTSSNELKSSEALLLLKELISIFKEGHARIIPFYPDLKIDLDHKYLDETIFNAHRDRNLEKLLNTIEDYFDENKFDKYALNEISKDFFKLENMEEFASNIRIVFGKIQTNVFTSNSIYKD
jgi:exodeoxyribonuclease V gamma subunit